MENLVNHTLIGIPVSQNKQDFAIGVFTIDQVFKFTKYTSRLIVTYDDDGEPIYNNHIQRELENSRVEKIADFLINDPDATFPTNIVLHVPKEVIKQQKEKEDRIELFLKDKVFEGVRDNKDIFVSIIDGQHRIRGIEVAIDRLRSDIDLLTLTLKKSSSKEMEERLKYFRIRLKDLLNIQLVVSFFIDKTLEYQAMIFSTINRTQKRVSQSLVYSLFGLESDDTPQKTSLEIVLSLNAHKNSPFFKRIKLYGGDYSEENSPPLSQATMVRSIINLISENAREGELDRFRKRKELHKRQPGSEKFLPFRQFYASNKDDTISDILFYYFTAVQDIFKKDDGDSYWDFPEESKKCDNILQTTVGYDSLLKILVDILKKEQTLTKVVDTSIFKKYLKKAKDLKIGNKTRYSFNNRGKRILYLDLSLAIWPPDYVKNSKDGREAELKELMKSN